MSPSPAFFPGRRRGLPLALLNTLSPPLRYVAVVDARAGSASSPGSILTWLFRVRIVYARRTLRGSPEGVVSISLLDLYLRLGVGKILVCVTVKTREGRDSEGSYPQRLGFSRYKQAVLCRLRSTRLTTGRRAHTAQWARSVTGSSPARGVSVSKRRELLTLAALAKDPLMYHLATTWQPGR